MQKRACDIIVSSLLKYNNVIRLNGLRLSPNDIFNLMDVIDKDYPELFFVDIKKHTIEIVSRWNTLEVKVSFIYNVDEIKDYMHEFMGIRNSLIKHVTNKHNTKTKLDCIYGSIAKSVMYNHGLITPMDYTISGPLLKHAGICEGYAKLLKYFCDAVGIQCLIVSGKGTDFIRNITENHAWNMVSFDGINYHHIDVTWDSIRKQNNVHNEYYLKGDAFMLRDHYWSGYNYPRCVEY
jgi:hypothetical protein